MLRIQPDEGISLRFGAKAPAPTLSIRTVNMDFLYGSSFLSEVPEAYETLLLDAIRGDGTLFTRQDGVERSWEICDPLLEQWERGGSPQLYSAGSWGPGGADELLAPRRSPLAPAVSTVEPIVVADLARVERELLRIRTAEGGSSVRATTLNLVAVAAEPEQLTRTMDALQLIGGSRPLRAIVNVPGDGPTSAEVSSSAWHNPSGHEVRSEQMIVRGLPRALPSAVASLVIPDLPVFLLWNGKVGDQRELFQRLAADATRLILDSDECGLGELIEAATLGPPVTDLAWARLTPWREAVASLTDSADGQAMLNRSIGRRGVRPRQPGGAGRRVGTVEARPPAWIPPRAPRRWRRPASASTAAATTCWWSAPARAMSGWPAGATTPATRSCCRVQIGRLYLPPARPAGPRPGVRRRARGCRKFALSGLTVNCW